MRAVNDGDVDGAAATVTSTPVTVPSAPQNLEAQVSDEQVALTWDAPASDGGSAIQKYQYPAERRPREHVEPGP